MLELNLRERAAGGPVLPRAEAAPQFLGLGRRRLVFLIHGFNLKADAARNAYDVFAEHLAAVSPSAPALVADLVGILWPGDAAWGPLSFASYPTEIRPAGDSADRLDAFLGTVRGPGGGPAEIYLVCHSLGNRVAMELLVSLAAHPARLAVVRGTCLMAAAVPVAMMRAGGRLAAAASVARTSTLYSAADWVLHYAFPLGETLARDGWMPEAVGRLGNPASAWTEGHPMVHSNGKGYGHGDYWSGDEVVEHVARMLGLALAHEPPVHAVLRRGLPAEAEVTARSLVNRDLPPTRALA